jgi:GNAT superfamily N-acetyltransferase
MELRHLLPEDVTLIGEIDRSEEISVGYIVEDGELVRSECRWVVPTWDPEGSGAHSVVAQVAHWRPVLERGAVLIGAFEGDHLAGLVIVAPDFEADMAWLAFLHVTRPFRRQGVATRLWDEAVRIAAAGGASSLYISAAPTESAVGFYLSKGCHLTPPHPVLFAEEPEDIHLELSLA